jgi:hypothetical protein
MKSFAGNWFPSMVFVLFLFGTLVYIGALFPTNLGVCSEADRACWRFADNVQMVISSMPVGLLVLLLLSRSSIQVRMHWLKFALIWIPVSAAVIYIAPTSGSFMWTNPRESFSILLPALFLLSSFGIIFWKSRQKS